MHVDDAGTLGPSGKKIEASLSRDDKMRLGDVVFGLAPAAGVEIGLAASRAVDRAVRPSSRHDGVGIALKWVPLQRDRGWSLGLSLQYGHTRINERVSPSRYIEREYTLLGLASHRLEDGQSWHLNLGAAHVNSQGVHTTVATWGLGYVYPLLDRLELTAEIYGEEGVRPDKALGLRYRVRDGLKLSGAIGRGNGRGFGQVGFAWEF